MEKFSKLTVLFFILISLSFTIIACDNADDDNNLNEDQYPAEIQAEAQEFCEYWAFCGSDFYSIGDIENPPAWDDTISGCKSFFYQNYDIYEKSSIGDHNHHCYVCLVSQHDEYVEGFGEVLPLLDQCDDYPIHCFRLSNCVIEE